MTINNILECFNESLNEIKADFFLIGKNTIERNIGSIKTATTSIVICHKDKKLKNTTIVETSHTGPAMTGAENKIIEMSDKKAIIELLNKSEWNKNFKKISQFQ